jgi:leader peptidase (prepilin peptidase)/N-methyltransferase
MIIIVNNLHSFVIGCCIGSFLNVIVYRFPNNYSIIKPRSFCPKCKTRLTWKENIPLISWFFQKGKCINCNAFINIRYPLIELITGILFVVFRNSSPSLLSLNDNYVFNILSSWLFLSLLICISLIDIDRYWIPQGLINFGIFSGILGLIFMAIANDEFMGIFFIARGILTFASSFLVFESLRKLAKCIFKKEAIGKGDSKLVAMLSLWLGPIGTLFAVGIAYVFAAFYCLVALSTGFLKLREVIPFAPFLSLGGLFIWFLGNEFIFEKILRI